MAQVTAALITGLEQYSVADHYHSTFSHLAEICLEYVLGISTVHSYWPDPPGVGKSPGASSSTINRDLQDYLEKSSRNLEGVIQNTAVKSYGHRGQLATVPVNQRQVRPVARDSRSIGQQPGELSREL